jgi:hypothetical protein
MASDTTSSDLEGCLSAVVSELRVQHDLANRLNDPGFRRAKMMLLECSLSTYQWLAVERMRRRNHPHDTYRENKDLV